MSFMRGIHKQDRHNSLTVLPIEIERPIYNRRLLINPIAPLSFQFKFSIYTSPTKIYINFFFATKIPEGFFEYSLKNRKSDQNLP